MSLPKLPAQKAVVQPYVNLTMRGNDGEAVVPSAKTGCGAARREIRTALCGGSRPSASSESSRVLRPRFWRSLPGKSLLRMKCTGERCGRLPKHCPVLGLYSASAKREVSRSYQVRFNKASNLGAGTLRRRRRRTIHSTRSQ